VRQDCHLPGIMPGIGTITTYTGLRSASLTSREICPSRTLGLPSAESISDALLRGLHGADVVMAALMRVSVH
jgi:hypothetical protein